MMGLTEIEWVFFLPVSLRFQIYDFPIVLEFLSDWVYY